MATAVQAPACSLENYLAMPDHSLDERIAAVRAELGERVIILGHHYQRDEVIRFADFTGDSYRLSKRAAESKSHLTSDSASNPSLVISRRRFSVSSSRK